MWFGNSCTKEINELRKEIQNVALDVAKLTTQLISLRGFVNRKMTLMEEVEEEEEETDAFGLRKN